MDKYKSTEKQKMGSQAYQLVEKSFKIALEILKEKKKKLISHFDIKERCHCGWQGKRWETKIVGEQESNWLLLCCPGCGRTVRSIHPKDLLI